LGPFAHAGLPFVMSSEVETSLDRNSVNQRFLDSAALRSE
jgi:hypothetical protein